MRNLLLFISRNQFTFLFILLECFAIALLANSNSFHNSIFHQRSTALAGVFYDLQYSYSKYIGLLNENEKLARENALLRQQGLSDVLSAKQISRQGFSCLATQAITSTYHLGNNYLVVAVGSDHGVQPEFGVMGPEGLVGFVHSVSKNYSTVMPIIHNTIQVSARLKKSNYFGLCSWLGTDDRYVALNDIPNHVEITDGDTIVTRGSGGIFPPDIVIGFADGSTRDESTGFQRVNVRLATDFRRLHTVYVIFNDHKTELDSLENHTESWVEK